MRTFRLAAAALIASFAICARARAESAPGAKLQGRVEIAKVDASGRKSPIPGWDLSDIVVYLVPEIEVAQSTGSDMPRMSQKDATFDPPIMVVSQGQTVEFPNDDKIDHNVFSFSESKRFDLGIYPKGASHSVRFDRPGPVFIYCSIHEKMNAIIYVTPNSFHARTNHMGEFAIEGIPAGKYKLLTWNSRLPETQDELQVTPDQARGGKPLKVQLNLADFKRIEAAFEAQ